MSFVRYVKLLLPSGNARPGPAIGQSLGPLGINMAEFCKQFNERSDNIYKKDVMLRVKLSAMSDRSFTFVVNSPPTSFLIKRAVGLAKGPRSPSPDRPVASIPPEAVYEIAKLKQRDEAMQHLPLEGIARSVVGQARNMGVLCKEANDA